MGPIAWVGIAPIELNERVSGPVWERWTAAEPVLAGVRGLDELHELRKQAADAPLGGLIRLAAKDGGDDQLAATAVAHQLQGGTTHLIMNLRDLSDDVEAVVIGSLWAEIRSFPWRRRTRAFAASLMFETRAAAVSTLLPGRRRGTAEPVVLIDPVSSADGLVGRPLWHDRRSPCEQSTLELVELLDWALASCVVERSDVTLLLELIAAGDEVGDGDTPRTLRGTSSQAAVLRVAELRGVCDKTVMRQRDQLVATLRESTTRYLAEVA